MALYWPFGHETETFLDKADYLRKMHRFIGQSRTKERFANWLRACGANELQIKNALERFTPETLEPPRHKFVPPKHSIRPR